MAIRKLVFATNNAHKLSEVRSMLEGTGVEVVSLSEIGCHDDIAEMAETLEGNALIKARYVRERYGLDCFADDTGLEVEALGGRPGVYSARYAGEGCTPRDNIRKLLGELEDVPEPRRARFRTVVALILEGSEYLFEGEVEGEITLFASGEGGFGYDPVFRPEGYDGTFADLGDEIKNGMSHRARAVERLSAFLHTLRDSSLQ